MNITLLRLISTYGIIECKIRDEQAKCIDISYLLPKYYSVFTNKIFVIMTEYLLIFKSMIL